MNDEEFERKYLGIINTSLDEICLILAEVEVLDTIIKENQIRKFRKKWFDVLYKNNTVVEDELKSYEFRESCKYLFNRMNSENKIEKRISDLSLRVKDELKNLYKDYDTGRIS